MTAPRDTIAAIATPAGQGSVGIVRLSGPAALSVAQAMVGGPLPARRVRHAILRDARGDRLDDVLVVAMPGPASFTGEDVVELQAHGGDVNLRRILRDVVGRGARIAEPGEFSRRAFENGRLDLVRAEAILGVISASSERAWRVAQRQLDGGLGKTLARIRQRIIGILADVEAAIDFPEEGIEASTAQAQRAAVEEVAGSIATLIETFPIGRALRDGVEVAIVGEVNAGKSALFNALAQRERAIVADAPGTTRDYLEVQVEWDGVRVTLIDTAGQRVTDDPIEQRGMAMATARARDVDLVLEASDAQRWVAEGRRVLRVATKIDLGAAPDGVLGTSARTGEGIDALRQEILQAAGVGVDGGDSEMISTERQREHLTGAAQALARALESYRRRAPLEVAAADLREAGRSVDRLLGTEMAEDVLDELFARFCIGK